MTTGTRALELLSLLQGRRHWPGDELARRLEVSPRTLRRDVDGLQKLGYPITTTRGTGGGYQLSPGASLPPLVLSEDEATAVVMGLKEIASGIYPASEEAAVSAMAKIVQVLPERIRRRIDSLQAVAMPQVSTLDVNRTPVGSLTMLSLACRDNEALVFTYRTQDGEASECSVHPHRIVSADYRLYLIAWDLRHADWRTFRIDHIDDPRRSGKKFAPRQLPHADPVKYVHSQITSVPARYPVRATVHAPIEQVEGEVAQYGSVEARGADACEVFIPADSLEWAAFILAATGAPFVVHGPPEAIEYMRGWARRLTAATEGEAR